MSVYAIRKRRGQWAVCADDNVLLQFETYDEAIEIARSAAGVSASRRNVTAASGLQSVGHEQPAENSPAI